MTDAGAKRANPSRLAAFAAVCAAAVVAGQIAGKAARDALFLSNFDVTFLPPMIIGASVVSVIVALVTASLMRRLGPARLVPGAFLASAILWLAEWFLLRTAPAAAAIVVYLHMAVFGAVLISGFWSLANELFDPHTAKRQLGRVTIGANLGGLVGGIIAERVSAMFGLEALLPTMAVIHLGCMAVLMMIRPSEATSAKAATPQSSDGESRSGLQLLVGEPHLRNLAIVLMLGTLSAGLVDYVMKAEAAAEFTDGDDLGRFFAIFYTVAGLITLAAQTGLARRCLEKLGLARTIATLPASVGAFGGGTLVNPGLITSSILRGTENVLRNSLFRSGYELLYTPIPRAVKRATKTIIDVGFDRMGDAIGAALVAVILLAGPETSRLLLLSAAIAFAAAAVWLSLRLHKSYVETLEKSLLNQAEDLDLEEPQDNATRMTMMETLGTVDVSEVLRRLGEQSLTAAGPTAPSAATQAVRKMMNERAAAKGPPSGPAAAARAAPTNVNDTVVKRILELRSGDAVRVQRALRQLPALPLEAVPAALQLLAWDRVCNDVIAALRPMAPRITGQLVDLLLDVDQEFATRRRLPRVLSRADPQRAAAGLLRALTDRRFEVRFQCGRALLSLMETAGSNLTFTRETIIQIVLKELEVSKRVWDGQRLLDSLEGEASPLLDGVLAERGNRSLEHVFALLALFLPRQPVKVALRGLHTDDLELRGTALEYLETALPDRVRRALWPFVGADAPKPPEDAAAAGAALERLLTSQASIEINLGELRKRLGRAEPDL